jgi:hypothetical protein
MKKPLFVAFLLAAALAWFPIRAAAQEEVAGINRYRGYEQSSGYYEDFEVRPREYRRYMVSPEERPPGMLGLRPSAAKVRIRTRLADSHMGIKFYENFNCQSCHPEQARNNRHVFRSNLGCRQCHGGEPVAAVQHYYSPLNPLRRHSHVCAKCHEGANASFAAYMVHEPKPFAAETAQSFPALYYVFWIMAAIFLGTFVVFLPHTFLWGVRELFKRKEGRRESGTEKQD